MRPIKFRQPVWDEHNKFKGWHYWGFINGQSFTEPLGEPESSYKEAREQGQQYTGIDDKNGVEIYEGDRLKSWNRVFTVVWNQDDLQWGAKNEYNGIISSLCSWPISEQFEIIGDIYEVKGK